MQTLRIALIFQNSCTERDETEQVLREDEHWSNFTQYEKFWFILNDSWECMFHRVENRAVCFGIPLHENLKSGALLLLVNQNFSLQNLWIQIDRRIRKGSSSRQKSYRIKSCVIEKNKKCMKILVINIERKASSK